MNGNEHRDVELSEVIGLILSSQAVTRARFKVILQTLARILAHHEDSDAEAILEELKEQFAREKEEESEVLKGYLRRQS
jgi:hypothetical protein